MICLKIVDLIIYIKKGILFIDVEINVEFWKVMLLKLIEVYIGYMILELLI